MCWSPDVGDGLLVQYQLRVVRLAAGLVGVEGQHLGSVASISDQVSQERVLRKCHIPITHSYYVGSHLFLHTHCATLVVYHSDSIILCVQCTIRKPLHTCFCGEYF